MMKKPAVFVLLIVLLGIGLVIAPTTVAQDEGVSTEEIDVPVLDQSAMENMTREERIAYQQAYKTRLEEIAATHGWSDELSRRAFGESSPQSSLGSRRRPGLAGSRWDQHHLSLGDTQPRDPNQLLGW